MAAHKIQVFLAIDSARIRVLLRETLNATAEFHVMMSVADPLALLDGSIQRNGTAAPHVALVDASFSSVESTLILRRLAARTRCPLISLASARDAAPGSDVAMERLGAGVLDVLQRPEDTDTAGSERVTRILNSLRQVAAKLGDAAGLMMPVTAPVPVPVPVPSKGVVSRAVLTAGGTLGAGGLKEDPGAANPSTTQMIRRSKPAFAGKASIYKPVEKQRLGASSWNVRQVVLMGASTGGTEALCELLQKLPLDMPGICIVQHIPPVFSKSFADRLNAVCALEVREAVQGEVVRPGLALVAPGGYHMELKWQNGHYEVKLTRGPEEHHQRPAVDVLFRTGAEVAGRFAVGVLLTGMGRDGALGMQHLRKAGAINLAQDEKSCVVYGMPAAARELGVVDEVVSLSDMHLAIQRRLVQRRGNLLAA